MQKKAAICLLIMLVIVLKIFSQNTDSSKNIGHFSGAFTATTNGIFAIPTFTLNKPAAIVDLSIGNKKLSFEPEFSFSMQGNPWIFLFSTRYKWIDKGNFHLQSGAIPSLSFGPTALSNAGITHNYLVAQRYMAGELTSSYSLNKNIAVGLYYLYSRGLDFNALQNTHFLDFSIVFSNIHLFNQYYVGFIPQVYYLTTDGQNGFYFTSLLTLSHKKFPVSFSSQINQIIKTDVAGSQNFVWNLNAIYSFGHNYNKRK